MFKVPEEKLVYSKKPSKATQYTKKLDKEYSKYAKLYDWSVKILPVWKTWIKAVIPYIEGERVLEASFGTGYLLMQYADRYKAYGIDYNRKLIEVAQANLMSKGMSANLLQADIGSLPFPNHYFDTVVNTMAFTGYPDGTKAMGEMYRVLKVNGTLLLVDFDYPANRNRVGYWLTKLMESAGDVIKDISKILQAFPFEFTEEEIGGFGSVHLFRARKIE